MPDTQTTAPQIPPDAAAAGAGPANPPGPAPTSTGTPRLNAALARVQAQLPRVDRGETAEVENKQGQVIYTYKYANLDDVTDAIVPLLGQHGLAFTSFPTMRGRDFVLAYSLLHESGEERAGEWPLPGNVGPQQLGSHLTYARRYCLCAVTGVAPASMDDDGAAAQNVPIGRDQRNGNGAGDQVDAEVAQARAAISREWRRVGRPELGASVVDHYGKWSNGGNVMSVDAAELRRYLAFLATLPDRDSGKQAEPAATDAPQGTGDDAGDSAGTAEGGAAKRSQGRMERPQDPAAPGTINAAMRTRIQAALAPLYGKDRAARIKFLREWAGRPDGAPAIESANDLSWDEARRLIDELERDKPQATEPADDTQSEA